MFITSTCTSLISWVSIGGITGFKNSSGSMVCSSCDLFLHRFFFYLGKFYHLETLSVFFQIHFFKASTRLIFIAGFISNSFFKCVLYQFGIYRPRINRFDAYAFLFTYYHYLNSRSSRYQFSVIKPNC